MGESKLKKRIMEECNPRFVENPIITKEDLEYVLNKVLNETNQEYPKSKTWDRFMKDMFNKDGSYKADVWYDVLDSTDVGEILDWIIEFMNVHKKWLG